MQPGPKMTPLRGGLHVLHIWYKGIVRPANRDWACQTERCHTLSNMTSLQ